MQRKNTNSIGTSENVAAFLDQALKQWYCFMPKKTSKGHQSPSEKKFWVQKWWQKMVAKIFAWWLEILQIPSVNSLINFGSQVTISSKSDHYNQRYSQIKMIGLLGGRFLDASSQLYQRVCPSVHLSARNACKMHLMPSIWAYNFLALCKRGIFVKF